MTGLRGWLVDIFENLGHGFFVLDYKARVDPDRSRDMKSMLKSSRMHISSGLALAQRGDKN